MNDPKPSDAWGRSNDLERMRDSLQRLAPVLRAYYTALIEAGFTNQESMELTKGYQAFLIGGAR